MKKKKTNKKTIDLNQGPLFYFSLYLSYFLKKRSFFLVHIITKKKKKTNTKIQVTETLTLNIHFHISNQENI